MPRLPRLCRIVVCVDCMLCLKIVLWKRLSSYYSSPPLLLSPKSVSFCFCSRKMQSPDWSINDFLWPKHIYFYLFTFKLPSNVVILPWDFFSMQRQFTFFFVFIFQWEVRWCHFIFTCDIRIEVTAVFRSQRFMSAFITSVLYKRR